MADTRLLQPVSMFSVMHIPGQEAVEADLFNRVEAEVMRALPTPIIHGVMAAQPKRLSVFATRQTLHLLLHLKIPACYQTALALLHLKTWVNTCNTLNTILTTCNSNKAAPTLATTLTHPCQLTAISRMVILCTTPIQRLQSLLLLMFDLYRRTHIYSMIRQWIRLRTGFLDNSNSILVKTTWREMCFCENRCVCASDSILCANNSVRWMRKAGSL